MTKERLMEVLCVICLGYFGWLGVQVIDIKSDLSIVAHRTEQMWEKYIDDIAFANIPANIKTRE